MNAREGMDRDGTSPLRSGKGEGNVELVSALQRFSFAEKWYDLSAESHFWFQWRLAAFLEQLKRVGIPLTTPLKALEVGGGTGVLRSQVERSTAWNVDMTDLDIEALNRADSARGRTIYYDVAEERHPFVEAYDVVVLFDVLEHIPDTQPFLASVIRHIKPNGFLCVNVPALQPLFSKYDESVGHVRRYNKKSLAAEVSRFTMEVQDLTYWGMTLVPLLAARKLTLALRPPAQERHTITCGFNPPHPAVHNALRALMRVETAMLTRPPLGSSLLMAARKSS